jgi:hypothetical protein
VRSRCRLIRCLLNTRCTLQITLNLYYVACQVLSYYATFNSKSHHHYVWIVSRNNARCIFRHQTQIFYSQLHLQFYSLCYPNLLNILGCTYRIVKKRVWRLALGFTHMQVHVIYSYNFNWHWNKFLRLFLGNSYCDIFFIIYRHTNI